MLGQITAAAIFVIMFALIVSEKTERHIATLACGAATLLLVFGLCLRSWNAIVETINLTSMFQVDFWYHAGSAGEISAGINWSTIIFVAGMMIMVEGMSSVGFFRWLCMAIAKMVRYRPMPILVAFMLVSGILSMFIDSITVILFLAAVTVELAEVVNFSPVPVIMAEIFCANLGGSATMCGDPPNIIIGTSLGYTFMDFLTNTGVVAGISLIVVILYFSLCMRNELSQDTASRSCLRLGTAAAGAIAYGSDHPAVIITDRRGFIINAAIFALAVVLLITHASTGFTVALIGVIIAFLTLIASGKKAPEILKKIDRKTLLFFIGLFIVVGGLEQTGVLEVIASFIEKFSHGNNLLIVIIIMWISGFASAFVDNIPFAATMIPVISSLSAVSGMALPVLAWSLAIGTDIGGSATPVGASANVVGISVVERHGYRVGWSRYCKSMLPVTIMVIVISTAMLWLRYGL